MTLKSRRYMTHDCDQGRVELVVEAGGNGDWYVSIVPEGHKIARLAGAPGETPMLHSCVRVTTSGERSGQIGAANAVAALYRAMGGEVADELREELTGPEARDLKAEVALLRGALATTEQARDGFERISVAAAGEMDRLRGLCDLAYRALDREVVSGKTSAPVREARSLLRNIGPACDLRALGIGPDAPEGT